MAAGEVFAEEVARNEGVWIYFEGKEDRTC